MRAPLFRERGNTLIHVAIVGLKSNQERKVERRFSGTVKFTFLPADRSNTRLPAGADWVVVTRFTQHRWSRAATAQFPRRRVSFCAGGVVTILQLVGHALSVLEPLVELA